MVLPIIVATLLLALPSTASPLGALSSNSSSQKEVKVDSSQIEKRLQFISHNLTKGRLTGSPGNLIVASYIREQLHFYNLKPFIGESFTQSFPIEQEGKVGRNIVAKLPSIYPSESYIILSANYDHLGILGGSIFNGADKNSSGVTALLTLVEWFSLMRYGRTGPHINILFLFYDGRESNMAGSNYFAETLPIDKEQIILNINLDQIGCSFPPEGYGDNYLLLLSDNRAKREVSARFNRIMAENHFNLEIDETLFGSEAFYPLFFNSSDQIHLSRVGVPSILLTSGIHLHTNKPTDQADIIDLPLLIERIRVVYHLVKSYVK